MTNAGTPPPPGPPVPPAPPPTPRPAAPAFRAATAAESALAGILIGGAFVLVGIAALAAPPFADKLTAQGLAWGAGFGGLAVLLLLLSIFFGGRGIFRVRPGPGNAFDWQARFGILGVVFLVAAGAVFAFGPKRPDESTRIDQLERDLSALRKTVDDTNRATRARLDELERGRSAPQAPQPAPPKPKPGS